MRLSAFNVYLDDYPEPGSSIIYNRFTGAFVTLPAASLEVLRRLDRGEPLSDVEAADALTPDYLAEDVAILVSSRAAEERAFRDWLEAWRSKTDRLSVIVSTTFACNFACTYCCQADVLDGRTMTLETARATAAWLASRARAIGADTIDLVFVGGEPLLHPNRIEAVLHATKELAPELAIEFRLLTNGVFLTPELVDRWKPLGLIAAQVTLDGDETTHSCTRPSKKGDDLFGVIFQNVIAASHKIRVTVNGNYQANTVHGFAPLIEKLRSAGLRTGSTVKFSPALNALGAPPETGAGGCTWSESAPEYMVRLFDNALAAGFDPGMGSIYEVGPCGFHLRHHYAIDPDGHLYKCPGFLGKQEWNVGHVRSGLSPRYDALANLNPQRACGDCSHRPACGGGCVAAAWIPKGIVEGVNCEIEYFESQKRPLVIRKHLLATSATVADAELATRQFAPPAHVATDPNKAPLPNQRRHLRVIAA